VGLCQRGYESFCLSTRIGNNGDGESRGNQLTLGLGKTEKLIYS